MRVGVGWGPRPTTEKAALCSQRASVRRRQLSRRAWLAGRAQACGGGLAHWRRAHSGPRSSRQTARTCGSGTEGSGRTSGAGTLGSRRRCAGRLHIGGRDIGGRREASGQCQAEPCELTRSSRHSQAAPLPPPACQQWAAPRSGLRSCLLPRPRPAQQHAHPHGRLLRYWSRRTPPWLGSPGTAH